MSPDFRRRESQSEGPAGVGIYWQCKWWWWFGLFGFGKWRRVRIAANWLPKTETTTLSSTMKNFTHYHQLRIGDINSLDLARLDWKLQFEKGDDTYSSLAANKVKDDGALEIYVSRATIGKLRKTGASAKGEICFWKWTPHTDSSPHSPQIVQVTSWQSSTMLWSVQWCDCVVTKSQKHV
jgi:hypothetical protein